MTWGGLFRKALGYLARPQTVMKALGYAGTALVPLLAATGIGIPVAVVAAAASAGGVLLHLADPPPFKGPGPSGP